MKKLAVVLCLGLVMSVMTACGNDDAANNQTQESTVESTQESSVESSTESSEASQESTPATEENAGTGVEEVQWSAELQAVKDSIIAKMGENYWPDTKVAPEYLEGLYGITPDMYDDYLAENLMIATNVDTLIIIKPKADQFDTVLGILQNYQEGLKNGVMMYPMNVGKHQASVVEATGDYVYFVQLGADVTIPLESGDEAVIEHCQAENDKVLAILREAFAK